MWAKINTSRGFTIVELLIVIVVIGILAAITIVSFNGVQSKAYDSSVQSDVRNFGSKIAAFHATEGRYPNTATELNGLVTPSSTNSYAKHSNALHYCVGASGFAIGGASKSGTNGYYFSSGSGGVKKIAWWPSSDGKVLCGNFGITINTGDTVAYFSTNNTNGWYLYAQP